MQGTEKGSLNGFPEENILEKRRADRKPLRKEAFQKRKKKLSRRPKPFRVPLQCYDRQAGMGEGFYAVV